MNGLVCKKIHSDFGHRPSFSVVDAPTSRRHVVRERAADGALTDFTSPSSSGSMKTIDPKFCLQYHDGPAQGFPHSYHLIILERANFQCRRSDPVADPSGPPTERRPCGWCTPWGSRMISSSPTPGWRPSASSSSEVEGERWLVAVWSLKFVLPLLCCQLTCYNYLGFQKNTTFHCDHTHRINTNLSPHIYRSVLFKIQLNQHLPFRKIRQHSVFCFDFAFALSFRCINHHIETDTDVSSSLSPGHLMKVGPLSLLRQIGLWSLCREPFVPRRPAALVRPRYGPMRFVIGP